MNKCRSKEVREDRYGGRKRITREVYGKIAV